MTRDQIINYALARLRDTQAKVFDCDTMCNYLNDAYGRVIGASPYWPFKLQEAESTTVQVVAPANSFSLPTDVYRVASVENLTDLIPMREITGRKSFLQLFPSGAAAPGPPYYYRVFNNCLEVFPYPQSTTQLRVEYFVRPGVLSAASSVPSFPGEYHQMLVDFLMSMAYEDDGNLQLAAVHQTKAEARLAEMKVELLGPQGDSYAQINDDLFY